MNEQERISVLEHLSQIIDLRFEALDKELKYYRDEMQRRLEGLNQLREDVVKDRSLFVRGETYCPKMESIDREIASLKKHVDQSEARTWTWMAAIGIGLVFLQVAIRFWPH